MISLISCVIFLLFTGLPATSAFVSSASSSFTYTSRSCLGAHGGASVEINSTKLMHVPSVSSLPPFSVYLLDMWGVMHDGSRPYPGVVDTISELKSLGKKLVILSNSSKRLSYAESMLIKLGFDQNDFEQIITSGEISWQMLAGNDKLQCKKWSVLAKLLKDASKKVFVFGSGDNDEEYVETAGWTLAPVSEADLILSRGTFTINSGRGEVISKNVDGEETYFAAHDEVLKIAAERRLPMLVSNPDRIRPSPDDGFPPMPGAIGDAYENALGNGDVAKELVKRIGKPHEEVYEIALAGIDVNDSNVVMVGDALETDIMGGVANGVATLWVVNDGVHGPEVAENGGNEGGGTEHMVQSFNDRKGFTNEIAIRPTFVTPHFNW